MKHKHTVLILCIVLPVVVILVAVITLTIKHRQPKTPWIQLQNETGVLGFLQLSPNTYLAFKEVGPNNGVFQSSASIYPLHLKSNHSLWFNSPDTTVGYAYMGKAYKDGSITFEYLPQGGDATADLNVKTEMVYYDSKQQQLYIIRNGIHEQLMEFPHVEFITL